MQLDPQGRDRVAGTLAEIACAAGIVLRRFEREGCAHRHKADGSPTTPADLAAEELILAALARSWPGIPVVAEETAAAVSAGDLFFLVDPLDGTRDFLSGAGEYSVNIALVAGRRPVAAAVAAPAMDRVWWAGTTCREAAIVDGAPSVSHPCAVRIPPDALVALVSRRHGDDATEACLAALPIGARRTASSALKFCLIAAGEADLYVRCGPTMEWDTAAGDHILTVAGGCVVERGGPLSYGHEARGYRNGPFAALGAASLASRLDLPEGAPG